MSRDESPKAAPGTAPGASPLDDDQTLLVKSSDSSFGFDEEGGDTGFDYSAFEESLTELENQEPDEPDTDEEAASDDPVTRDVLDLQRFPKDDATYDTRELGEFTVVTVRGRINESFGGKDLGPRLRGKVMFDLTEVERVTSFGVRSWLQMLDAARMTDAVFVRASPAVVNQVTMMRNFCGPAKIHSIVAPYACTSCGAEFGVPYEAIRDRAAMRARKPLLVNCNQCDGVAEMDEDPWVFFALDEVVIDEVPAELQRVLETIGSAPNHPPIEKSIVNDMTRVRFNGVVSADTRFRRAFSGLEGAVSLDFRTATDFEAAASESLLDDLKRLPEEVHSAVIEGAPLSLIRGLLEARPDRVLVGSAAVNVRSKARPLERIVMVDLRKERLSIGAGTFVPDVPWREDPLEIEDLPTLQAAIDTLLAPDRRTPAPALRSQIPAEPREVEAPVAPPPATRSGPNPVVLAAAGVLVAMLLLGSAVGLGVMLSTRGGGAEVTGPTVAAQPVPAVEGAWSSGGELPPSWSEVALAEADGKLLLVGHGTGATLRDASVDARAAAIAALLDLVAQRVPVHFEDEALPPKDARASALTAFELSVADLALERVQDARREKDGTTEMVGQYAIDAAAFQGFVSKHTRVVEFRGLSLAMSAPWQSERIRLTGRESFIRNVKAGDTLVSVGSVAVSDLAAFESAAGAAFEALPGGGLLELSFEREGEGVKTSVFKPEQATSPDSPTQPNTPRPTLFTKP